MATLSSVSSSVVTSKERFLKINCPEEYAIFQNIVKNEMGDVEGYEAMEKLTRVTVVVMKKIGFWNLNFNSPATVAKWRLQFIGNYGNYGSSVSEKPEHAATKVPAKGTFDYRIVDKNNFPLGKYGIPKNRITSFKGLIAHLRATKPQLGFTIRKYANEQFIVITGFSLASDEESDKLLEYYMTKKRLPKHSITKACIQLFSQLVVIQFDRYGLDWS